MPSAFSQRSGMHRHRRVHLRWLCVFWLAISPFKMWAQRYPVLPVPNSPHGIYVMMQDSRSGIWLGTNDDVLLFDGTRFYPLRPYGFPAESPNSLAEDSSGGIWIATQGTDAAGGTRTGNLYRYQGGQTQRIFGGDGLSIVSVAPGVLIGSFGTEGSGKTTYGDLYRFREKGRSWIPELLAKVTASHLTVDHAGNVLFPCPGGWCEIDRRTATDWPNKRKTEQCP